jgi:hypothetical protein
MRKGPSLYVRINAKSIKMILKGIKIINEQERRKKYMTTNIRYKL